MTQADTVITGITPGPLSPGAILIKSLAAEYDLALLITFLFQNWPQQFTNDRQYM